MRQKSEIEQNAAERQVSLLMNALEKAKGNGGVWLNPEGHPRPKMYPAGVNVSPFNALVMALHTDANEHKMALYTTFNTAKDNDLAIMKGQKGVPFVWYHWDSYVQKGNPENTISREEYKALPEKDQADYKAKASREVRTVFNIDQTTLPHKMKEEYENLQKEYGSSEVRGNDAKGLKLQVNHFLLTMRDNLVRIQHNGELKAAQYDPKKDTVFIPSEKVYAQYPDYVQDTIRQVMLATGYEQRLARVSRPTPEAMKQEALISELAAGIKMSELGLPAKISKDNMPHIDYWMQELQENPCLIDTIERDLNKTLDIVSKAERGEKVEYASKLRQDFVEKLNTPEVTPQECAILLDIIRHDGKEIDVRNFPNEEARMGFIDKFDLSHAESQKQYALSVMKDPAASEDAKDQAQDEYKAHAAEIVATCRDKIPEIWNDRTSHYFIADDIKRLPNADTKEVVVVMNKDSKVADVVMAGGANLKNGNPSVTTIDRIQHALMKNEGASYVRFFNAEGSMAYRPDDSYFANKDVSVQQLKGWKLIQVSSLNIADAVSKADKTIFDGVQMMRDDNGKWALYLKPQGEKSFAIHPDAKDLNQFFTTIKHGDETATEKLRDELAQKYYALASSKPNRKFDIFGLDAPQEDVDRITRANIFRTKDGKLMMMPTIADVGKQHPREITQSQWQRLWIAEDMATYKNHLAAKLFADVLHPEVKLEDGEKIASEKEESVTQEEKPQEKEQKEQKTDETSEKVKEEKEKQEEKAKEEATKAETKAVSAIALSPMLRQFLDLKKKHPDALLLFRCGDFYETYMQDARKSSEILGITLTRSSKTKDPDGKPLEMAGFPYHALDSYLPKLIRAGQRVAICDQIEPRQQQEQKPERNQPEQSETQSRGMRR